MEYSWFEGLQIAFVFFAGVQLVYYLFIFSRLAAYKLPRSSNEEVPVSVIIVAKNELENLRRYLPAIFGQNHREFEVIVVNNASWDGTEDYLKELQPQYPKLKVVTIEDIEKYPKGKKFAITLAIKASQYDTLLLTDADCIPTSDNWLSLMQQSYTSKTEVVLGYGAYKKTKGLLNYIIRYETFYTALQYFSFALAGMPYMGVGRNLSYRKDTFFRVKGFASHNHIMSGDDDLFVNEVATQKNTAICIHPDAFTISLPKTTWGAWFKQKRRHLFTGKHYKGSHKFTLALYNTCHILFFIAGIALLSLWEQPEFTGIVFGARFLIMLAVFAPAMKKLKEGDLAWGLLFLDIFYFIYYFLMGLRTLFGKQKRWIW